MYTTVVPSRSDKFSEFYILGLDGNVHDYPTYFQMAQGQITRVSYDGGVHYLPDKLGKVILSIVNKEQRQTVYHITASIDGVPTNLNYGGATYAALLQINLEPGQTWKQEIEFAPSRAGDNQKLDFFLFDSDDNIKASLHLWVNVKAVR